MDNNIKYDCVHILTPAVSGNRAGDVLYDKMRFTLNERYDSSEINRISICVENMHWVNGFVNSETAQVLLRQ